MASIGQLLSRSRTWFAIVAACVACNSIFDIQKPKHELLADGGMSECILRSDCAMGQVCLFRICSPPCEKDVDCASGQRCLHTSDATACVSNTQAACRDAGGQCPTGTQCVNGACYASCSDSFLPCADGYDCVAGACLGTPANGSGGSGGSDASASGGGGLAGEAGSETGGSAAGGSTTGGSASGGMSGSGGGAGAGVDPCSSCTKAQTCVGGVCMDKCTAGNCAAGCCDENGTCVTTLTDSACGTKGASCGPCTGTNHCVQGACGCASSADCPMYQACQANHTCTPDCSASTTCNGGCCDATTNQCTHGTDSMTCGASGMCTSCAGKSTGTGCQSNGTCGCSGPADCPVGTACNTGIHQCTLSCAGGLVCSGTCCDGANCQPGTTNAACGVATGSCTQCTGFTTCQNKACSAACTGSAACAGGGCCQGSTCAAATSATACGSSCTSCSTATFYGSTIGDTCVNGACGCKTSADCPTHLACNPTTHQCTTSCDGVTSICNTGCCSAGLCVAGTSASASGYNGEKCSVCSTTCLKDQTGTCVPNPVTVTGGSTCVSDTLTHAPDLDCTAATTWCAANGGQQGHLPVPRGYFSASLQQGLWLCSCGCVATTDCPGPSTHCSTSDECLP